ncbi:MAG: hypothetical protein ACRDL5_10825, partial [Solirubrobacteraceae bacterium]
PEMADERDEEIQGAFQDAQSSWMNALRAHRLAPPDAGFSARLAELSRAAHAEAEICWKAHAAGYEWPRHRAAGAEPPYELRPESGRRGPEIAWQRFDAAVDALNRATSQTRLDQVGSAYEEMSVAAGLLAGEVEYEDRASGLLPPRQLPGRQKPATKARKSA